MTEWIRTIFSAINVTRIGSIKTLILPSAAAPEAELQLNSQTLNFESDLIYTFRKS